MTNTKMDNIQIYAPTLTDLVRESIELTVHYNPGASFPKKKLGIITRREFYFLLKGEQTNTVGSSIYVPVERSWKKIPLLSKDDKTMVAGWLSNASAEQMKSAAGYVIGQLEGMMHFTTQQNRDAASVAVLAQMGQYRNNAFGFSRTHGGFIIENDQEKFVPEFTSEDQALLKEAEERFGHPFYVIVMSVYDKADLISEAHYTGDKFIRTALPGIRQELKDGVDMTKLEFQVFYGSPEGHQKKLKEHEARLELISKIRKQAGYRVNRTYPERLIAMALEDIMGDLSNRVKMYDSSGREIAFSLI